MHGRGILLTLSAILTFAVEPAGRAEALETKLLELARERFTNTLSLAEEKLFRAAASGRVADCRSGSEEGDDPANSSNWGKDRIVKANRLAWLCTDPTASALVTYRGIFVTGARIEGILDLEWANIAFPLVISKCAIGQTIKLRHCHLHTLNLFGTHIKDLQAHGLEVEKDVLLSNGFKAEGEVRLMSARIGGNLGCDGSQFINPKASALNADGAEITGGLFFRGTIAEGEVRFIGTTIKGDLACSGGHLVSTNTFALAADRAKIEGSVFLNNKFNAVGKVQLPGANIGGNLECVGGQFLHTNAVALAADSATIKGGVFLGPNFTAKGEVRFPGDNDWRESIM